MAFTYTGDLSSPLEFVRFKMNDNEEDAPIFQDEEIQYFINRYENPTERDLVRIAHTLLKQHLYKISMGPARERSGKYEVYNMSAEVLKTLIADLGRELKAGVAPQPFFGGVYKQQVERNREDPKLVDNVWERDQFDEDLDDDYPLIQR